MSSSYQKKILTPIARETLMNTFGKFSYFCFFFEDIIPEMSVVFAGYRLISMTIMGFHTIITCYTVVLQLDSDLGEGIFNLNVVLGCIFSWIALITSPGRRNDLIEIFTIIGKQFYKYGENFEHERAARITGASDKLTQQVTKALLFSVVICNALLVIAKFVENQFGFFDESEFLDGVYQNSLFKIWLPFTFKSKWIHAALILYNLYLIAIMELSLVAIAVFLIITSQHIAVQLDVLKMAIEGVEKRAYLMFGTRSAKKIPFKLSLHKNAIFVNCYEKCLNETAAHHQVIIRSFNYYSSLNSIPLITYITICAIFMTVSAIALFEDTAPNIKALCLFMLVLHAIILGALCFQSERIISKSGDLFRDIYNTNWIYGSNRSKTALLLMGERMQYPLIFSAFGVAEIKWNLFTKTIQTFYSYVNLFLATKQTELP